MQRGQPDMDADKDTKTDKRQVAQASARRAPGFGLGFGLLGTTNTAPIDDEQAQAIFASARELGIVRFDTAPLYGGGLSEVRLGRLLRGVPRKDYVLSSKVGRYRPYAADVTDPKANAGDTHDYSRDATLRSIERSLHRLGTDRLDIVFIHDCEAHLDEAANGAWVALFRLREEGVIGRIGCGSNLAATHEGLLDRVELDVLMVANCCSLLDASALHGLFPRCRALGVEVEVAAPFSSGILATGPDVPDARFDYRVADEAVRARVRRIERQCLAHGVSLRRAALHYAQRHPVVSRLILGLVAPDGLRGNQADLQAEVPEGLWDSLRACGIPDPLRQDDMP